MSHDRARLKIHDADPSDLMLIHEIGDPPNQPSYLILWDIELAAVIYCSVIAGGPLMSGLAGASTQSRMVTSGCSACLGSSVDANTEGVLVVEAGASIFGAVTGGHC
jgi:hypothetical protein